MDKRSNQERAHLTAHAVGPRMALLSILGFWLFYFLMNTLRNHMDPMSDQISASEKRAIVTLFGMVLSYILYLALRPFDGRKLGTRIAMAFLASVPTAAAYATINYCAFYLWHPSDDVLAEVAKYSDKGIGAVQMILDSTLNWYFFIVAWAVLYVALSYAAEVQRAERSAAGFRAAAQAAELRALRYQVNPHFLFNTLNSLSSLVLTSKSDEAERMIMNLSTFFRTSLTGDPTEDVPLFEEIRLQRLYLDIEAVRFPDRLKVEIEIPDQLRTACVPGLILQPLVENAIKYGVSRARRPVTLSCPAPAPR
jgi:two-component system, LytTR family, sensor kinase